MLKIDLAQISVVSANPKKNFDSIQECLKKAKKNKQNIIVFPEMSIPGYFNGDIWEQSSFLKECEFYHEKIKELSHDILIIFGSVGCDWHQKNEDGRVRKYNAAFCASNGTFLTNSKTNFNFWPKTLLPNYKEFDDSRHFYDLRKLAFEKNCLLQDLYEPVKFIHNNKIIPIGISICEDAWNENYSVSPIELFHANNKHDFFINLS